MILLAGWCCKQVCATILQIQVDRLVIFNVLEELLNITSHVQILERLCHISTHHQVVVLEFSIEIVVINFVIFLIIILFSVLVKRSGLKYTSYNHYRFFFQNHLSPRQREPSLKELDPRGGFFTRE